MSATLQSLAEGAVRPEVSLRDFIKLTKPGVLLLVVFTAITGIVLAPVSLHPAITFTIVLSIAMGSAAGAMFNMWYDRDIDAIMKRTQHRPIVSGQVAAEDVLVYGVMLSLASVILLGLVSNWAAAGMLAFAIFFYAYIYTHLLKRHTPQNIVIGGAAGAFPPVIGWLAVTGEMHPFAWLLFAIIFFWTPPHFWALALYRNDDYTKANIPMLPVTAGIASTKRHILGYSFVLLVVSILPALLGYAGALYLVASSLLGLQFCRLALRTYFADEPKIAMQLFGYSIIYLFALFAALMVDRWVMPFWG